jgi:hypothetical protein
VLTFAFLTVNKKAAKKRIGPDRKANQTGRKADNIAGTASIAVAK